MRLLLTSLLLLATWPALAQDAPKTKPKREAVPIDRLVEATQVAAARITRAPTVGCALPLRKLRSRPSVYRYMLTHLPLASRWLKALGKGDYVIKALPGGGFSIDDKAGATADCSFALEESGLLVVLAKGRLEVPVLPRIRGSGVILVRYRKTTIKVVETKRDAEGKEVKTTVTHPALETRAQVDFRVQSRLLHALGRAFRGSLQGVLTQKLEQLVGAAIHLAQEVHLRPTGVYRKLKAAKASKADLLAFKKKFLAL